MQYALLAYGPAETPPGRRARIAAAIAEVLGRPYVSGWVRLHSDESATTLRSNGVRTATDGPFIDSKEYLAGLIMIEAENLDGALDVARSCRTPGPAARSRCGPSSRGMFRGA